MEFTELQSHLVDEAAGFRDAATTADPTSRVTSCPDWTVAELIDHLTEVYEHKIQCMRLLREPEDAEATTGAGDPVERFDSALSALLDEFDARGPESLAYTWYGPDQSVGFWIRRLACETVVHRADAELAASGRIGEVDHALGIEAIAEMLEVMLSWGSRAHRESLADDLAKHTGLTVALDAGTRSWTLRVHSDRIDVTDAADPNVPTTVSGGPGQILMWLWRRLPADAPTVHGDPSGAADLYELVESFGD